MLIRKNQKKYENRCYINYFSLRIVVTYTLTITFIRACICVCLYLEHLCHCYMDSARKITSGLDRPSEYHLYLWVFLSSFVSLLSIELLREGCSKRCCQQNWSYHETYGGVFEVTGIKYMQNVFLCILILYQAAEILKCKSFIFSHSLCSTLVSLFLLAPLQWGKKILRLSSGRYSSRDN